MLINGIFFKGIIITPANADAAKKQSPSWSPLLLLKCVYGKKLTVVIHWIICLQLSFVLNMVIKSSVLSNKIQVKRAFMTPKKHRLFLGHICLLAVDSKNRSKGANQSDAPQSKYLPKAIANGMPNHLLKMLLSSLRKLLHASTVHPIVAHATYLINIASPDKKIEHASVEALVQRA